MHGYSFGFDWLEFQAHWLNGKRITLALVDRERVLDIFSGVLLRDKILAGPESALAGALNPTISPCSGISSEIGPLGCLC